MADVEKTEFNLPAGKGPGRGGAHAGGRPTDSAIDANAQAGDNDLETNLRPKSLEEFIGQPKVRNQLDLVHPTTCCFLGRPDWAKQRWP